MSVAPTASLDRHRMAMAIAMARRGLGQTAPNPAVGAVLADPETSEIIARGWTQPGGRPHAETEAIRRAGYRAKGATLYVTLEPCSHHGKTPPCCDAVIAAGIGRVVCAIGDPDPRVAGRGLDRLRAHGIAVTQGVLAEEAHWLTRGHIVRVTERRPLIQLKLALSADGEVPRGGAGQPTWVTGPEARAHGHLLRAEADAILVGRGTLADDDPELTCRLPGLAHRSPIRVVLASKADLPLTSKLARTARQVPVWVFCGPHPEPQRVAALETAGVKVTRVTSIGGNLWLPAVTEALASAGITRLLVEGGPATWAAFGRAGLIDEAVVFRARAPAVIPTTGKGEAGGSAGLRSSAPLLSPADAILKPFFASTHLDLVDVRRLPADEILRFRIRRSVTHRSIAGDPDRGH